MLRCGVAATVVEATMPMMGLVAIVAMVGVAMESSWWGKGLVLGRDL